MMKYEKYLLIAKSPQRPYTKDKKMDLNSIGLKFI